jgi:hypothetical protein
VIIFILFNNFLFIFEFVTWGYDRTHSRQQKGSGRQKGDGKTKKQEEEGEDKRTGKGKGKGTGTGKSKSKSKDTCKGKKKLALGFEITGAQPGLLVITQYGSAAWRVPIF